MYINKYKLKKIMFDFIYNNLTKIMRYFNLLINDDKTNVYT